MGDTKKQISVMATRLANMFGFFGYLFLLIEWVWLLCLVAYPFLQNGSFNWVMPTQNPQPTPVTTPMAANPVTITIAVIITLACLGVTAYAFYKLPQTIGKTGAKITHKAAHTITPVLTHHRKVPKKVLRTLTFKITFALKFIALLLPLIIVITIPSFSALPKDVVVISTSFIALGTAINFFVQYGLAKINGITTDAIW